MNPGDSATRQEVRLGGPPTRTWWGGYHLADQVAPRGRKASSTRKTKPETSNLFPQLPRKLSHLPEEQIVAAVGTRRQSSRPVVQVSQ